MQQTDGKNELLWSEKDFKKNRKQKTKNEATLPKVFCYNLLRCPAREGKITHTPNQNLICIIEIKIKKLKLKQRRWRRKLYNEDEDN